VFERDLLLRQACRLRSICGSVSGADESAT
jgi:hypothetical protein